MEIKQPKKLGRPRIANPLTNAQRQKRWRERVKAESLSLLKALKENNAND